MEVAQIGAAGRTSEQTGGTALNDRIDGLANFLKTFERRIVKPRLRRLKPWRHTTYGDVHVNYRDHLDGGGRTSGMEYLPLLHDLGMPRQARVFEWCAGPGFIGFALLGYGFCDTLWVARRR